MHNFSYSKQPAFQEKPEKFKVQLKKIRKLDICGLKEFCKEMVFIITIFRWPTRHIY